MGAPEGRVSAQEVAPLVVNHEVDDEVDLRAVARRLGEATAVDQCLTVLTDVLGPQVTAAVLLERHGPATLRVVGQIGAEVPPALRIDDVRSTVWEVLLGRSTLRWTREEDCPDVLCDVGPFPAGILVGVPTRSLPSKVLAVAAPQADEDLLERTESLVAVLGPTIETMQLAAAAGRTRTLLEHVTELAGRITSASDPAELLQAVVGGVESLDVVDRAMVWQAAHGAPEFAAGDGALVLDETTTQRVLRSLDPAAGPVLQRVLAGSAPLPDGRLLTLLPLDADPRRVLGIVHRDPLDGQTAGVFTTLAGAVGPALRQAEMTAERRTLVAAFGERQRPDPALIGCDVGVEHHPNVRSAEAFGGDFYDWFVPAEDRFVLALGDVSGKGIPAAAASSMAVWTLRALGRQGASPGVLAHLMDTVVSQELGDFRFVTLALADVDLTTWTVRLVLAGHPVPLLLGADADADVQADRPLGALPDGPAFHTHILTMAPGATMVLHTDGITEAQDATGVRFGRTRLQQVADQLDVTTLGAQGVAEKLWATVHAWSGGPPDDDCAIIVLRRP